ncbi:MAG TPA: ribosome biogenesis GTP-binding protein YsxC, partial [Terriglobales bacterium]|nr:ribosome biogenesis GTP-binding protein YsxC [Terriglobales bacterium]
LFVEPYLKQRLCLALCLALIDINVPPQETDRQLRDFLASAGRPFLIVATKSDKLSGNQLQNALTNFSRELGDARVLPFSAKTGAGRDELWREIRQAAQALQQVQSA